MGCSSSSSEPPVAAPPVVAAEPAPTTAPVTAVAPPAGKGGGKGRKSGKVSRFQIILGGKWKDYGQEEDAVMKRAYMTGNKKCKFNLRGQHYEYDFKKMVQINKDTRKERKIRPPQGAPKPPKKPILPTGPMVILSVKAGQPGTVIQIDDPNNPGQKISVAVPAHAKPGSKMAIPLPAKGESVEVVTKRQEAHDKETGAKTGWSTGAKVAAGGAAAVGVAAVGVGGVILGDHLAGGDLAETIGEAVVDAGEAAVDAAEDAGEAIADWAPGAAEDVGEALADAGEDVGEWAAAAADDVADWLGDAAEDVGDFVTDLF